MYEPTKKYFSISEVGKLVDEQQHVLRYWEREFTELRPKKNSAGNRIYTQKDLDLLCVIKIMLRRMRLSVVDAKSQIKKIDVQAFLTEHPFIFAESERSEIGMEKDSAIPAIARKHGSSSETDNDMVMIPRAELRAMCELLKDIEHLLRTV